MRSGPEKRHLLRTVATRTLLAVLGLSIAAPAAAQLSGNMVLDSDYRLRGYSLTNDRPAASVQLTYDHPSGLYLSLSGVAELGSEARFLGIIGNAGYARRLHGRVTLDAGVLRYQLRRTSSSFAFKYTEIYAGAYIGRVAGRIYYSPSYRAGGPPTLYGEFDAGFEPAANWHVSGHVGLLTYLGSNYFYRAGATHRDWRVSAVRRFGRFELHSAFSGGGPSTYYSYRVHKKFALTVGASVSF